MARAAPVFASFGDDTIGGLDGLGAGRSFAPRVTRWNREDCGSPLEGRFDYVSGRSWAPLGVIEEAGA